MTNEKILNEQLTDDQLDGVAGGAVDEFGKDVALMKAVGVLTNDPQNNEEFKRVWARMGVSVIVRNGRTYGDSDSNGFNEYYAGGKQISREAALNQMLKMTHSRINLINFI